MTPTQKIISVVIIIVLMLIFDWVVRVWEHHKRTQSDHLEIASGEKPMYDETVIAVLLVVCFGIWALLS